MENVGGSCAQGPKSHEYNNNDNNFHILIIQRDEVLSTSSRARWAGQERNGAETK